MCEQLHEHDGEDRAARAGFDRRRFLGRSSLVAASIASAPAWLPRAYAGAGVGSSDTLVLVYLRGAMDGLTAVAPYADGDLYVHRPTLAIAPPGGAGTAVDLDGFFGLAPAAAPLLPAFQAGDLAIVHACGSPDPTRSHFDAMKFMELGTPNQPGSQITTGWLARHLGHVPPVGAGTLRALASDTPLPRAMTGASAVVSAPEPAAFDVPGDPATAASRRAVLELGYQVAGGVLGDSAASTFATIDLLSTVDFAGYVPAGGAVYPTTSFGDGLRSAAAMIKTDIGLEAIEVDLHGWDHHAAMGPTDGVLASKLDELSRGLAALHTDLATELDRVTVVVMTEFGRRVAENASNGTDHGHGGVMMVIGGAHVIGGQVHGTWPGLASGQLVQGDLAITTDYRDVVWEILASRMGATDLAGIFPTHAHTPVGVVV